jgi:hypothetical protein
LNFLERDFAKKSNNKKKHIQVFVLKGLVSLIFFFRKTFSKNTKKN